MQTLKEQTKCLNPKLFIRRLKASSQNKQTNVPKKMEFTNILHNWTENQSLREKGGLKLSSLV